MTSTDAHPKETPLEDGRRLFDVNLFGAMRLIPLVVPQMRQQRSGRIINVSSVGGRVPTPLGSPTRVKPKPSRASGVPLD